MKNPQLKSILSEKGYCYLTAQSAEEVDNLINTLGKAFFITDVKVRPDSKALVTSAKALDVHTDHHRAQWILWHCIKQTDIGGESILVDAIKAYQSLDSAAQKTLTHVMLLEHKIFGKGMDFCPVVREDSDEIKFYYSFWLADKNMPKEQKAAFMSFRKAIETQEPVSIKLNQGDVLIVNNHRILHGRREIKGHQKRLLKRFWIE